MFSLEITVVQNLDSIIRNDHACDVFNAQYHKKTGSLEFLGVIPLPSLRILGKPGK